MSESPDDERRREEAKKERERTRMEQRHSRQLSFDDDGKLSREFLESLIDVDELQNSTAHHLRAYCSRQWMLSNLTDAEAHDQRWKFEVLKYKIYGMHPPQESAIQGPIRAFLYDDPQENLYPLTPAERQIIESFVDSLKTIVTQSRDGFERQQINTDIRQSRTESDRIEDDGGGGGRLSIFRR